jgi:predicted NBD/HSP70 family sugar kinase
VFGSNRAALRYFQELGGSSGLSFQDLLLLAEEGDQKAGKALDQMARAVGRGVRILVAGLAPEEIVVVGEFTRLWSRVGEIIEKEAAAATLVGKPPLVRPATDPRMARLRGTVALVLQKHFGATSPPNLEPVRNLPQVRTDIH